MAKAISIPSAALNINIYFMLLVLTLQCGNSARILDEIHSQPSIVDDTTKPDLVPASDTLPSGQFPAIAPTGVVTDADQPLPGVDDQPDVAISPAAVVTTVATLPTGPNSGSPLSTGTVPNAITPQLLPNTASVPSVVGPVTTTSSIGAAASAVLTTATGEHPLLSFFMHDILGGTHPSARVVTGIIANSGVNGLPFSKTNGQVFPINGGVPLPNNLNGIINNNNNIPFLTGLNSGSQTASTILQNNGNNNVVGGGNQPFVTGGQLPLGASLQELMFGTITVIDDELTEGHELGSAVMGKAQGFYLASSLDGTSQTMAITTIFHNGQEEDSISFFGVHRTASLESHISIVGGTGKYENAEGYATIGTLHLEDQHTTDGVDTILQINVYLSH